MVRQMFFGAFVAAGCAASTSVTADPSPTDVVAASAVSAEETPAQSVTDGPFRPIAFLLGDWTGDEDTSIGRGRGARTTRLVLGGAYIRSTNRSEFPPDDERPNGEVHEDWEIWSYDRTAGGLVIRQFNSEGFINHFVQKTVDGDSGALVFETIASENAPPGLRARLTFEKVDADRFVETFEIYWPGRDEPTVFRNRWRRR